MKEPKDLGIKIGSKDEAMWTEFRDKVKTEIAANEKAMKVNKAILDMAEQKIDLEKEKFK